MPDERTIDRRFRFTRKAEERVQAIMDRLGTNDLGQVVREALRLYEWAIEEIEAGKLIAAIDRDGEVIVIDVHERRKP